MVEQSRSVFLQALIVTIIVFIIGLVLGFSLESNRVNQSQVALLNSEINFLDEQVRTQNIRIFNISCDLEFESTFSFADRIYRDALTLEEYDSSSKFTNELINIHKKYDLLRIMLWTRAIEMKKSCPRKFHTVVYLFNYSTKDINTKARQGAMSRLLTDLKNKHGGDVLLIPVAANLNLESVNLILEKYDIKEIPAIIVDEDKVVKNDVAFNELEDIVFEKNNFESLEGVVFKKTSSDKQEKIILNANKQ